MLRQRNAGGPEEEGEQGIFIGDQEVDPRLGKPKAKQEVDVAACWKLFSLVLIVVTGISLCFSTYQMSLVAECVQQVQVINNSLQHKHGEWEANRQSLSECRAELKTMEYHLNTGRGEKVELETEVARLKRVVLEGEEGAEKWRKEEEEKRKVQEEERKRQEEEQGRVHLQQREHQARVEQDRRHREEDHRKKEEERKQEEQRKHQEEAQRQQEDMQRKQQEIQRQQEELQKQQELQRKEEELKRQQEELHRQQEEQQRQQEEHQRQQEEEQRHEEQ